MRTAKRKAYKRWLFALSLLLAVGASVNAQMIMSKFEEDPLDQEAKLGSPRPHPNRSGELYALIKISTTLSCTDFMAPDFGTGAGMGEVECSEGRVWMYAPAGATKISIRHNVAGTVENHPLPSLKAGTVYLMTLTSGTQRNIIDETLDVGRIAIDGFVEGATLKIGDVEEIMTGKRWVKSLRPGSYTYEISAYGYETDRGRIVVKQEETISLTVNMVSSIGEVSITSTPEQGAAILIDGKMQAVKTPATISLDKGNHSVTVTKEFYKSAKQEVRVKSGEQTPLSIELTPNFAVVSVRSADDGKIFIDNNLAATGSWQDRLEAGLHTLVVEKESHRPYKKSITVAVGKDQTLEVPALEPIYGKLDVEIVGGYNAKVFVDDAEKSSITPTTVKDLLVGKHALRLMPDDPDWQVYNATVEISESKITPLKVTLTEAPRLANLIISTTPSGAGVYVNNERKGTSPLTLPNVNIDVKQISIKAVYRGYRDREMTHTLTRGDNLLNLTLEEIQLGSLKVSSNVSGATIYLNGSSVGITSYSDMQVKDLPTGAYTVRVSYPGYNDYEGTANVRQGSNTLYAHLKAKPFRRIPDPTTFIDWRVSPPTSYVGMSVGMARRWGGYAAFRASKSMFNPYPNVLDGDNEEFVIDGLHSFEETHKRLSLTGGVMLRLASWLYVYGGAGYGMYAPQYRYEVKNEDNKTIAVALATSSEASGLEVEYGAKVNLGGFTLSAGHSIIPGSDFGELHFGAGMALGKRSIASLFGGNDFSDSYIDFDRNDIHQAAGGFHLKIGGGVDDVGNPVASVGLHYNNSKAFPLNFEVGAMGAVEDINFIVLYGGMYSSLHLTEHFSIDFGGGYQWGERSSAGSLFDEDISQPYYKAGLSYMFKGSSWGGFNYSYQRGFAGKGTPIGTHLLTYTIGTKPTWGIIITGAVVGLIAWSAANSEEK
ncbi:MAG: PEGA domain-containing protein [Prevotellaceae bacterium]|jgi:hypothetical protein|nr:PEGA domain-containing protein [Prevotellaceae bacterium]